MIFYVLNKQFEKIGVVDDYVSFIWTTRYFESGDFEIYVAASEKYAKLFKEDYYIKRQNDNHLMIIENVNITTSVEDGDYIKISGRDLKSILDRRIIWRQKTYTGKLEVCVRSIIDSNFINTTSIRKIPQMTLGTLKNFSATIDSQYTGANVLETVMELCKVSGLGFDVKFENNKFVFEMYSGKDRSFNQSENLRVLFSTDYGNIINSEFNTDKKLFKNTALIGGEGEGNERTYTDIGTASGIERRELFVDAKDLSSKSENDAGEEIILTPSQYQETLKQRGLEKLSETAVVTSFDGEIETTVLYKLYEDFNLGDVVSVKTKYGVVSTPRIVEIIESEDASGHYIIPTFEKWDEAEEVMNV